jgi:hypothetical protein
LIAAITGLGAVSSRSSTRWPKREMSSAPRGSSTASSLMSAPEMKLFSPAPVTISAPCSSSSRNRIAQSSISPRVSRLSALRTSGRLTARMVIGPRRSIARFL